MDDAESFSSPEGDEDNENLGTMLPPDSDATSETWVERSDFTVPLSWWDFGSNPASDPQALSSEAEMGEMGEMDGEEPEPGTVSNKAAESNDEASLPIGEVATLDLSSRRNPPRSCRRVQYVSQSIRYCAKCLTVSKTIQCDIRQAKKNRKAAGQIRVHGVPH
jgi:hypothetical protein